jgi:glycolate oxidase
MLVRPPFPRPAAAKVDKLRKELSSKLGDSKLITDPDAMFPYAGDESEQEPITPDAVVKAESPEDIRLALEVANDLEVPITPRAAGSGKSGGSVPVCGGILLCVMGMSAIKEIDAEEHLAVVEPGLILGDLYAAVEQEGLFYPPDPNSWKMCTIGGNIAENAAGPRSFKYGMTREYVLGMEVLTATGTPLTLGRRTKKGVCGYDLTALMTGSEGTLAIVTQATLRVIRPPEQVFTLLCLFERVEGCAKAVAATTARGLVPRCLEMVDEACLDAMRKEGVSIDERAGALLIVEVDGDEDACMKAMEQVGECAMGAEAVDVLVAQDAAQRERLWHARRELSNVTRRLAKYKISEDVVVPRRHVPALIRKVQQISEETGVRMLNYGHAGDGNIHVNVLWDDPVEAPQVEKALDALFRGTIELGGTLTGEHGIGTSKSAYLEYEQSAELIGIQRDIKKLFDPKGILNPGKIFPRRGHGPC